MPKVRALRPPQLRVTSEAIARNPVAQAIERATQRQAARDFAIRIYSMQDGELFASDGQVVAHLITVALRLLDTSGRADELNARVLRGGLSALVQASERGWTWRKIDAPALDIPLSIALAELTTAKAVDRQAAYQFVQGLTR